MGLLSLGLGLIGSLLGNRHRDRQSYGLPPVPPEYSGASSDTSALLHRLLTSGATPYGGELSAKPSTLEDLGFTSAAELFPSMQRRLEETASGKYLTPESNPFLKSTYDTAANALTKSFREGPLKKISDVFQQAGLAFSTPRARTTAQAGLDLGDQLARISSDIYGGNYQRERDRMLQAEQMLPGVVSGELTAGDVQRQLAQDVLDRLYGEFRRVQPENFLGSANTFLGTRPRAVGTGTTSRKVNYNTVGSAAGGFANELWRKAAPHLGSVGRVGNMLFGG